MSDPPIRVPTDPPGPTAIRTTASPGSREAASPGRPGVRVVLVPGLGLDRRSWSRVLTRLAAAGVPAEVVALPGSGVPTAVPELDVLAALVGERLGEGPVVLAGHSQGCQAAAAAATDARVAALVLCGPTTDPRLRSPLRLAARWLVTAVGEPLWQVPLILVQWVHTGPRAMRALWRRASPDPIGERLARLAVPVTVVRGTRDRLCDADWAATVAAAARDGQVVELPGAAHMTVQTRPDAVAAVLLAQVHAVGRPGTGGALPGADGALPGSDSG